MFFLYLLHFPKHGMEFIGPTVILRIHIYFLILTFKLQSVIYRAQSLFFYNYFCRNSGSYDEFMLFFNRSNDLNINLQFIFGYLNKLFAYLKETEGLPQVWRIFYPKNLESFKPFWENSLGLAWINTEVKRSVIGDQIQPLVFIQTLWITFYLKVFQGYNKTIKDQHQ